MVRQNRNLKVQIKKMTKLNLYSSKGIRAKKDFNLPKSFDEKSNLLLLSQAVRVYEDSRHFGLSKTKTRGEIDLTKKKVYRQKGTGMARHGAKSAPIFVGGSKAHGPKGIKRVLVLPKKMKEKATKMALLSKINEKEAIVLTDIGSFKKTKEAHDFMTKVIEKEDKLNKNTNKTFFLSQKNASVAKVLSNLDNSQIKMFKDINTYNLLFGGFLIIDEDAFMEEKSGSQVLKPGVNKQTTIKQTVVKKQTGRDKTK